mmetsp:Transcript_15084/g.22013  ORF Transcript_15084/g.22013 Transcript_15084/m.22013 type:complete len:790 (-) Transcript_15084:522-2891(-)
MEHLLQNASITTTHHRLLVLILLLTACCSIPVTSAAQGTDLGGGVITRTPVSDQSRIAYDLRQMFESLPDDGNRAKNVYMAGFYSALYDSFGNALPNKRSIRSFSTEAGNGKFSSEPTFLFHMAGLSNNFDPNTYDLHYTYADDFVMSALQDSDSGTLAAEAARALNLWMYCAHELWQSLDQCTTASRADINNDVLGLTDNAKGAHSIDEFIAYWIGEGQTAGSSTQGYALYALTQQAGQLFNTLNPTGEAKANTNIKLLYENKARTALAASDTCTEESDTVEQLWHINNSLLSQMYVPLLQMLIHNMVQGDVKRVRMYALAVVPQFAQCRPSVYRRLKSALLEKDYDGSKRNDILTDLQSLYSCLGISCKDIGAYQTDVLGACGDPPVSFPMAEYIPSSPVREYAELDLDIWNMKLLLNYGEKAYPMAKYLYLHGKNSYIPADENDADAEKVHRTLHSLAESDFRKKAIPYYEAFVEYFNDNFYSDRIILDSLGRKGRWGDNNADFVGGGTFDQRYEVISTILQYQVVHLYLLAEIEDAVEDCIKQDVTDNDGNLHSWDEVAALVIGSLEGAGQGGSKDFRDGQFIWSLANKMSVDFGSAEDGFALVNSEIEDLLYAGKGMIQSYDCADFTKVVTRLRNIMLIPLIQSVIKYATKMEGLSYESNADAVAKGEAFTLCALPIIYHYDKDGAKVIEMNMLSPLTRSRFNPKLKGTQMTYVEEGPQAVADAFWKTMRALELPSRFVGSLDGADPSKLGEIAGSASNMKLSLATFSTSVAISVLGSLYLFFG